MTKFIYIYLASLFFISSINGGWCAMDFCDGDPRIRTIDHDCHDNTHAIHLLGKTYGNPNHALHDWLWALSFYMMNCTRGPVTLFLADPPIEDVTQCSNKSHVHNILTSPYWSLCVVASMVEKLGPKNIFTFEKKVESTQTNTTNCYRTETFIGVVPAKNNFTLEGRVGGLFRFVRLFGRNRTENKNKVYNDSTLRPLPYDLKAKSFQFIQSAVYEKYGISPKRRETVWNGNRDNSKIRILVYTRNDTSRRIWINTQVLTRRLNKIKDVTYKILDSMPKQFVNQLHLFSWADIIVAPHGAAMANTVFTKRGGDIIEIWKHCLLNVVGYPKKGREWTNWHAGFLKLNLTYVQCHVSNLPFRSREELFMKNNKPTDGIHKVREEEIFAAFYKALQRQREIIGSLQKPKSFPIAEIFGQNTWRIDNGRRQLERSLFKNGKLIFVLVACACGLVIRSLVGPKKRVVQGR